MAAHCATGVCHGGGHSRKRVIPYLSLLIACQILYSPCSKFLCTGGSLKAMPLISMLCFVCRYEPPSTGLVLRDTEEGGLISKPERFQELAHISKQRHLDGVYFWIPVAPPGYSVIGCIAGKSSHPDEDVVESIRCVRNDLVCSANFSDSCLWTTRSLKPGQQQLSVWPVENEVRGFLII